MRVLSVAFRGVGCLSVCSLGARRHDGRQPRGHHHDRTRPNAGMSAAIAMRADQVSPGPHSSDDRPRWGTWAIVCSASAVIVRLGFTPGLAGSAEPSVISRF